MGESRQLAEDGDGLAADYDVPRDSRDSADACRMQAARTVLAFASDALARGAKGEARALIGAALAVLDGDDRHR